MSSQAWSEGERGLWGPCLLFSFLLLHTTAVGCSPDLPPEARQGEVRPGDKGQLGGEGKGHPPVPSSPEAQDFLGSQFLTLGTQDSEAQAC